MRTSTRLLLPLLLLLAAPGAAEGARAATNDWSTAVLVTEASGVDERTVKKLGAATLEACSGTALWVQRTLEETEVVLRTSGLNPRSCASDVPCLTHLGRTAHVRYVVAIGASRIGEDIALTVDIVDTTWERTVGHGERTITGGVRWIELMTEVVTEALPVSMRRPTGTMRVSSNIDGATVLLDGRRVGATPLHTVFIGPGEHEVVVRHPDYPEYRRLFEVEPGGEFRVDALLEKPPPPPEVKPFWNGRRIGVAAGSVLTVSGLAMGIGFASASSEAEALYYQACQKHSGEVCSPNKPLPRGENREMKELRATAESRSTLAGVGFVTAAAAGA
ncbi:MAG: PEGA domain-containing protein, partial [Myxococcales bacterium]